jgi:Mg2+-importing ATPase
MRKSRFTQRSWLGHAARPQQHGKRQQQATVRPSGFTAGAEARIVNASRMDTNFYLAMMDAWEHGLSKHEVEHRRKKYGLNVISHERAPAWYVQLLGAFANPFIGVLLVLVVVALFIDVFLAQPDERDYGTVIVIGAMITISTLLRFWQEFRSNRAAHRLREFVRTTILTQRKHQDKREIDVHELVPGDVVWLSAGNMIPADLRLMYAKDLFVSQAVLTGESIPVEKTDRVVPDAENRPALELENICFMGTTVVSGTAKGLVINTGNQTYFGGMAASLLGKREQTSFDKGVNSVSWLLIRLMVVMVSLIFLINGLTKSDWFSALLFSVSVAVGLTPEMLPMIVSANLAKGAVALSKRRVIVKKLAAMQNIGAMDILCTDKTGTLTIDKVILLRHLSIFGDADDAEVLKWAYLNSFYQTGLKNLLDRAIIEYIETRNLQRPENFFTKIDELPFDFERRRMSVVLEERDGRRLLVTKGATEEMLSVCAFGLHPHDKTIIKIDENVKKHIRRIARELNQHGLRVLLVANRYFDGKDSQYTLADEDNLVLVGFIAFLDPPKPSAKSAIESLRQYGVNVKVLTGDNEAVTKKICSDVGIPFDHDHIVLGSDIEQMSDKSLSEHAQTATIFAKLSPAQKVRVVKALQAHGHVVGFMGDGINDAAALRTADVGISVDTATDIAKESADIILLEKDLGVLHDAVHQGRLTFGNIIKYINMAVSSNFGNILSVLGASAFLPFLPMLPIQLLVQNLLYDVSQTAIPWDTMDKEYLKQPRKWETKNIARFMLFIGPISSVVDYATFAVMWFVFGATDVAAQSLFQSGWFVEGLLSQTLIVHLIRTQHIPFIQSRAALPVIAMTIIIMAVGIALPLSPIAPFLRLQALPLSYFWWLTALLVLYCLLAQVVKVWFIKRFDRWL